MPHDQALPRQHYTAAPWQHRAVPTALHCNADTLHCNPGEASTAPAALHCNSVEASLQLRRGFIATLAELRRPRGASLQLRGRFIATPMDLRRPPWRFIAAPAVPAILHRNAGESLSASLVAAARRPACSTAPPCGELADVAQLLSSASRLQHVRQVAPSCDTIDGCSTPQDPRRPHHEKNLCGERRRLASPPTAALPAAS